MKTPIAASIWLCSSLFFQASVLPVEIMASKEPAKRADRTDGIQEPPGETRTTDKSRTADETPPPGADAVETPVPGDEAEERQGSRLDPISEEYLEESQRLLDGGDVAGAIDALLRARARSPRNRRIERSLREMTGAMRSEAYYASEPLRLGKGLSSPLQFLLLYEGGGEAVPVAGVSVVFDFVEGDGVLTGEAITNDLGIAKCYIESITDTDEMVLIRGRVSLGIDGFAEALGRLTQTYEFTSFSILDAPHTLLVSFDESRPLPEDELRAACETFEAVFRAKAFSRFACGAVTHPSLFRRAMELERSAIRLLGDEQGAKVLLLLDIRTAFASQPSPDFHFYRATLTAKLVDVLSFRLYFEGTREERGAGPNPDDAERQALRNALARLAADLETHLGTSR